MQFPNLPKQTLVIALFFALPFGAISQTLAEKLGYSKEDKLLIIHGDDVGVAHSQNIATFEALKKGLVTSTSMMVPPAWSAEVGVLAKDFPDADIGIHITLTNEWENFNWPPKAGKSVVPGLSNEQGFMYPDCPPVTKNASPEEVEIEIRAQIKAANQMGIQPTHLDSHMGCIFYGRPEYMRSYLKIAQELKIPAMVNTQIMEGIIKPNQALFEGINLEKIPVINEIIMANPEDYEAGMEEFYTNKLENLKPGVHVLLVHLAFDDEEMNAVTAGHTTYHASWRQEDFNFFTSDQAKKLIQENNIKLITWKEIGKIL
ncbi:polysaccharide deacetylase family protein [Algoriphagus lutimaris]|uniref:polysaccharide deacetylase family protein n=1 Tax=Algoriphagus lutimaris TaxID=613197 RepID=UPI00196A2EF8|nr:polysaccharide deacetylase family protein [Algoriphagus lutimaris]MBN3521277.1 polysaccharide deacetylase family protein [Algoriphagus lutimaris]